MTPRFGTDPGGALERIFYHLPRGLLVASLLLAVGESLPAAGRETFKADVAPLLAEKCQPCHFKGSKVYEKLSFDQYKTVVRIAAKLNTRLKGADRERITRWIKEGMPE